MDPNETTASPPTREKFPKTLDRLRVAEAIGDILFAEVFWPKQGGDDERELSPDEMRAALRESVTWAVALRTVYAYLNIAPREYLNDRYARALETA